MSEPKRVLQRVEIVLYLLVDDGSQGDKYDRVTKWCERNGSSLADFASCTDATTDQVAKDGWTDLDVYEGVGNKEGEDRPERYLGGVDAARPGCPPLALRNVWPKWVNEHGAVETFTPDGMVNSNNWPDSLVVAECDFSRATYRPHGATWDEVERLAGVTK